jgi:formate C-acetyltransferase
LFADIGGPISVIKSFSKPHFENAINGGPLTLEFHNSMFTDDECISKVAMLVKSYISMGGHQLQLNAINPDKLRDAQLHPENYRRLVVRIWGWSAYFVELDREFQDHVLSRQAYVI